MRFLAVCAAGCALAGSAFATETQLEFFEKRVRPILANRCYECHGPTKQRSSLRWDHISFIQKGAETGPVIVPGDVEASRMIHAVRYDDVDLQMPPKGRLPKAEIQTLERWVAMGAPWPDEPAPKHDEVKGFDLEARKSEHWSWSPIRVTEPPAVKDTSWPTSPIDRYILAKLEETGLSPTGAANKRTLIRRAYFDVIGLPPAPEEVESFVSDRSPDAFEKVVDRLLAHPGFGERWGRHWLDLMRYAESRGHEGDDDAPNAYQYRDYVIRALNADVPFDQFITEHLAGDLMPEPRLHPTEGFNESILGTGFWFLGEWVHSPVDIRLDELDRYDNMIDVASKTFLGLTVACARCHEHKFDAITTEDYYAMAGYLQSTNYRQVRFDTIEHNKTVARALLAQRAAAKPRLSELVSKVAGPVAERLDDYLLVAQRVVRTAPHPLREKPSAVTVQADSLDVLDATAGPGRAAPSRVKAKTFAEDRYLHWQGDAAGDELTLGLPVEYAGRYRVVIDFARAQSHGDVRVSLNGQPIGGRVSLYEAKANRKLPTGPIDLGAVDLAPGAHRLTIRLVGKANPASGGYGVGVDTIRLEPVEGDPNTAPYGVPRFLVDNDNLVQLLALENDLSHSVLVGWIKHLIAIQADPTDPLHAFTLESFREDQAWDHHIRELVTGWQKQDATASTALNGVRVIEDFTGEFDKPFLTDGFAFGDGPVQPGDIRIGADPGSPIARVVHTPGVHRDPDWKGLKYAEGRQTGTSSLDKFIRSGQTFRTDTFVVESENLWYLVRGAGYAYLNVDSHHMIRGPLHAKLVTSWNDDMPGQLRWVRHGNMKDYLGHNAHVEFSPRGDEEMAVLMVVESDKQPALPIGPNRLLAGILSEPAPLSMTKLAE
ncbi:MAG: DUF1549 domain-containing protein, partial [Planctomycetota bacterium]